MLVTTILALMMQVGPDPSGTPIPVMPGVEERAAKSGKQAAREQAAHIQPPACSLEAGTQPAEMLRLARIRADRASGREKTAALQCAGIAQAELEQWSDAADTFQLTRSHAQGDLLWQARIGGQLGYALIETGRISAARTAFQTAIRDGLRAGDRQLAGQLAGDLAIAEVTHDMPAAASQTLGAARVQSPDSHLVWLLSATLERRLDRLASAQEYIHHAISLAPHDPGTLYEAGLIAGMRGDIDEAQQYFDAYVLAYKNGPDAEAARIRAQNTIAGFRAEEGG